MRSFRHAGLAIASATLLLMLALLHIAPSNALANDSSPCSQYEIVHQFRYDGSDTTGCLGINRADIEASNGTIYYYDTYCGGMKFSTQWTRSGDKLKLRDVQYLFCKGGSGSADTARIAVVGMTETCFTRLEFKWLGAKKSYDFVARPTSCN